MSGVGTGWKRHDDCGVVTAGIECECAHGADGVADLGCHPIVVGAHDFTIGVENRDGWIGERIVDAEVREAGADSANEHLFVGAGAYDESDDLGIVTSASGAAGGEIEQAGGGVAHERDRDLGDRIHGLFEIGSGEGQWSPKMGERLIEDATLSRSLKPGVDYRYSAFCGAGVRSGLGEERDVGADFVVYLGARIPDLRSVYFEAARNEVTSSVKNRIGGRVVVGPKSVVAGDDHGKVTEEAVVEIGGVEVEDLSIGPAWSDWAGNYRLFSVGLVGGEPCGEHGTIAVLGGGFDGSVDCAPGIEGIERAVVHRNPGIDGPYSIIGSGVTKSDSDLDRGRAQSENHSRGCYKKTALQITEVGEKGGGCYLFHRSSQRAMPRLDCEEGRFLREKFLKRVGDCSVMALIHRRRSRIAPFPQKPCQ